METREGKLEQLKINLDDEDFQTSTSILEYLVERGEINPKSLAVSQGTGNLFHANEVIIIVPIFIEMLI